MTRVIILVLMLFLTGCQTLRQPKAKMESREDVQSALETITEALSGRQLSEEELNNLARDLKTDKEAQSAIQSITNSMSGKKVNIKYCPVTGKRYAPSLVNCPEHGVALKELNSP